MIDKTYLDIGKRILTEGTEKVGRNGITRSLFNVNYEWDLDNGFPMLTTKKISWKNILVELAWFMSGNPSTEFLEKHGCKFWRPWEQESNNVLGRKTKVIPNAYGEQWRKFETSGGDLVDQLGYAVTQLQTGNLNSRRLIVSAWNPVDLTSPLLRPCHYTFVFNVQYPHGQDEPRLCLHLTQRSCDVPIGLPYNLASYSLLLSLVGHMVGIKPWKFAHSIVDAHIYDNQIEAFSIQLDREPKALPELKINEEFDSLETFDTFMANAMTEEILQSIQLIGYDPHPFIKIPVST